MFCLKLLPLEIDIVICKVECVHDIQLIRAVKHGCGNVESKCLCRQGEMDLEHLSNVHTGRHAERVQHDIKRTPVRQIRHILHRKHTRDNTLVAVTSSHLITNGDLSFLCDIDAHCLVHSGCKLRVAVRPWEHLRINHHAVLTVRHFQWSIAHLPCLLTEDRPEEPLLRCQLGLSLWRDLTDKDIAGTHLRTDPDDPPVVKILERIITDARNISRDLLGTKLCVARIRLVLFYMNGSVYVFHDKPLTQQNGILIIISFPCHETDQRILTKSKLPAAGRCTVSDHLSGLHMISLEDERFLIVAVGLVAPLKLV